PEFQRSGIELAPLTMPLGPEIHTFPSLAKESFYGLPGLLADALPDKFGNILIDEWLVRSGRDLTSFTPVERLCYVGARGMGALEFEPVLGGARDRSTKVDVGDLVRLAADALSQKKQLDTRLTGNSEADVEAMRDILRVGTSAGGARAKAVIAWNESTGEVRSGQIEAPSGFGYWLLKFDGVSGNSDKELEDPTGYGKIEYAYHLMAQDVGIEMTKCRLFEEHGRSHFMTKRFDRTDDGEKVFMQSLCALGHFDFNQAGAYSYEQAIEVAQQLGLTRTDFEQLFLRATFNIMARNQDDHTKNIAFLMDKSGAWRLAPAFDVIYSYNPDGAWTSQHQMSLNGKRDGFNVSDLRTVADRFRLFRGKRLNELLAKIDRTLSRWPSFAETAGVTENTANAISKQFRRLDGLGDD
ncbi:MAG: type II toxin-antitoxin system HipA family toxin, partial [Lacipirellulaceae bacterium]